MSRLNVHTFFFLYFWIYLMDSHYVLSLIPNCAFEDTVELTDSHRFSNDSYRYQGVLLPQHLIGYYDYIEVYKGARQTVPKHLRGCVCQLKKCFKLCCTPWKTLFPRGKEKEIECVELQKAWRYSPYVNITLPDGSEVLKHALNEFVVQVGQPCEKLGYPLMPHLFSQDQWHLYENGTLWRVYDNVKFTRRDYCMSAYEIYGALRLQPYNCAIAKMIPPALEANTIVLLISLPFLFLTILTYWSIPELYNILHNKCLICYLLSLAIANTMIISVNMRTDDYKPVICTIIGAVAYFFYLAAFFWLNVICFYIWMAFCRDLRTSPNSKRKHFFKYSLYAWGLPILMTAVTLTVQWSNIPIQFKSGIGYSHCWLKTDDWSAMMYFHGPCLLLISFNTVLFYVSARKIYSDRKHFRDVSRSADSARHLKSQQHSVWLFFRLFVVMGLSWVLEMIGYMLGPGKNDTLFFKVADYFNASQGLIVFSLFVMKKTQLLLIKERLITLECKICACFGRKLNRPGHRDFVSTNSLHS